MTIERVIGEIKERLSHLERCSDQIPAVKTAGPAPSRKDMRWDDDQLPKPVGYVGDVPEYVEEYYQVRPLIQYSTGGDTATVLVWLHTWCRRKYNTFAQKNWSKAWTTDAKDGGNAVNVGELTTWLYSYIDDGNNTRQKSVSNGNMVEQGPHSQDNTPWPGFTPYKLTARSWSRGPTIEGREVSIG